MKHLLFLFCLVITPCYAQVPRGQSPVRYDTFFPKTEDPELKEFFSDPNVFWYTEENMPKVYQQDVGSVGHTRFISVYYDIGPGGPRYANGNGEWPWAHPSTGIEDGRVRNIIGIYLPSQPVVFKTPLQEWSIHTYGVNGGFAGLYKDRVTTGTSWRFPPGTDIVELVTNRIGRGDYTFKVHRMTMQPSNEWLFRVYRPFDSREEYEKATLTVARHKGPETLTNKHMVKSFKVSADVWEVPPISPEKAANLLTSTPFKLCKSDDFIPTTDHYNQIYPKGYLGAFIGNGIDQQKCINCHKDVLTEARKFDNGEWYGFIRGGGNDKNGAGVFSWYPR